MQNKLILWLLLLPLLLSIYGIMQYSRNYDSYNFFQKTMAERMDLAADVKVDPDTQVRFENGTTILGSDYILKLDNQFARYETEISLINLQHGISIAAIIMAVLSLLLAGFTILLCINGAHAARQSRDLLLSVFKSCRKLLPFILTGQMVLAAFSFLCLIFYEAIWLATKFIINQDQGYLLFLIGIVLLAILGYILLGLFKLRQSFAIFQGAATYVVGKLVSRAEAPSLWYWIDSLAEKAQTSVPDNIIIGFTEYFYVTSHQICLNNEQIVEGRTLYFPLSHIALLNRDEIGAVIVHKFAFFKGDNRRVDLDFLPIYSGINQSINGIVERVKPFYHRLILSPSIYIGRFFLAKFNSPVNHWDRISEHEANQVTENLNLSQVAANSLNAMSAMNEVINQHLNAFYRGELIINDLLSIILESRRSEERAEIQNYLNELFLDTKAISMAITKSLLAAATYEQHQK